MSKFRDIKTLQKFATVHASTCNHFNPDRFLTSRNVCKQNRSAALAEWRQLVARYWRRPSIRRPVRNNRTAPFMLNQRKTICRAAAHPMPYYEAMGGAG